MSTISSQTALERLQTRGLFFQLIACLLFACYSAVCWLLTQTYPVGVVLFFKNFGTLVLCLLLFRPSIKKLCRFKGSIYYFGRGVFSCLATSLWLYCFTFMSMDDVTAINFTAPLFTLIFAFLLLKERVEKTTMLSALLGFIGVVIIFQSLYFFEGLFSLIALFSPILWSFSNLCFKKISLQEDQLTALSKLALVMTLLAIPCVIIQWQSPTLYDLLIFSLMALASLGVHYFQIMAYQRAPINLLQPFEFSRLLFVIFLELLFFRREPSLSLLLGSFFIFFANFSIFYFANRKKEEALC